MASPTKKKLNDDRRVPTVADQRRYQRVRIDALGRFMLSNRREYPCQVTDMSPGGATLMAPVQGRVGERIVAYVDQVGRIEGLIVRQFVGGFAMSVAATQNKRDKLAAQLTWLANRTALGLSEQRREDRLPPQQPFTSLILPDGREVAARILDMSISGAAVATEERPPTGTLVTLGRTRARVVRHIAEGIGIEFLAARPGAVARQER